MKLVIPIIPFVLSLAVALPAVAAETARTLEQEVALLEQSYAGELVAGVRPKTKGHLRLEAPADARPIFDGAGRPIGWLFGATTLLYDIDPADSKVVRYNVDEASDLTVPEEGKPLRVPVKGLVWLSPGAMADVAPAPAVGNAISPPDELLSAAFDPKIFEPEMMLAEALVAGDGITAMAYGDLGGGKKLYWALDGADLREFLGVGKPRQWEIKYREGWPDVEQLDNRPLDGKRQERDPYPAEVRAIDLRLVDLGNELGRADTTVDYVFVRDSAPFLRLRLIDEQLDVTTIARVRQVKGALRAVTTAEGAKLDWARRRGELLVRLPRAMKRGEGIRLRFDYDIPLVEAGGNRYWRAGESAWYPQCGDLRRTAATFHAVIGVRKPFTAWGTGREVKRWEEGNLSFLELEEKRPGWFPVFGAGNFFPHVHEDSKGRRISVVSYAMERKSGQEKLGKLFAGLVDAYEQVYPKYPFSSLAIVEAADWGWGQAPAAYINITKEAYNPFMDEISQMYSKYANDIFAHEIAHAWWGHYFRAGDEDQWLEESFAEYSAAWILELTRKKGDMARKTATWRNELKDVKAPIPITSANRVAGEDAGLIRTRLLYSKGPWVLHCLRSELGDDAFFTLLRSFLRSFDGKPVRTEDLIGLLGFMTKKDWHPWFAKYVYGTEVPEPKEK